MRIYTKMQPLLVKIEISQQGSEKLNITLHETDFEESFRFIESQASKYGSPIKKGRSTSVRVREYIGGAFVRGKDKSVTFHGLTPKEFQELIVEQLED